MEHPEGKLLLFPSHISGSLVFTQPNKIRVPQVILARPFNEFELSDQHRLQRPAVVVSDAVIC
jgi:hypothetical protein